MLIYTRFKINVNTDEGNGVRKCDSLLIILKGFISF